MKYTPEQLFQFRLREAREGLGLSQVQLGEKAGIPSTAISHFEAGSRKPSFDSLRKLAGALEVSSDWLLGRTSERSAAAAEDRLYRDFQKLTENDREAARAVIQALIKKSKDRP